MEEISAAVGATGAALLQSDVRTADIPRTRSVEELFDYYFRHGWHTRDSRVTRGVPVLLKGFPVITDQRLMTSDEIAHDVFYQECVRTCGLQWFASVGFWAGPALWALSTYRTVREGPFEIDDEQALAPLSRRLTETATLSTAVGRAVLTGVGNALALVKQPALALDRMGCVIDVNAAADSVLDDDIRICNRRLVVRDKQARSRLDTLLDRMRTAREADGMPVDPIVVRRLDKRPIVIRVLPIDGAARSPFLGARALLLLTDLDRKARSNARVIAEAFGLTPAETRLAVHLAAGLSPEMAADEIGIAFETARNQLKAIFAKTDTHRQGELVALLAKLTAV